MTIDETDQNRTHPKQDWEKMGKDQTAATEKPDVPSGKYTKLRNKNQKGVDKSRKRTVQPGPSQAPDKSAPHPSRKLK